MNLTEHIPLPDPARGRLFVDRLPSGKWAVTQHEFSNVVAVSDFETAEQANEACQELTVRMAVARKLGA